MVADQPGFGRRIQALQWRLERGAPVDRALERLQDELNRSVARRLRRTERLPAPEYPQHLPVVEHRAEIADAVQRHPVVVICGETGSGKTTQLPKICLELGRGTGAMIGHTQPRRIAARSLAQRVADELHSRVGDLVGSKVRFQDRVGRDTLVKIMTDGILLAETQGDPDLLQYDTLLIDEAHERSLNIDFLLGYLKQLLPRRPDLKVIITSATIDPQRFSRHFDDAPVIEVSGRTYPVEVRYRPLTSPDEDEADRDRGQAIVDAVDELCRAGPGDVLVFLPGERDIREAAERLRKHHPPDTEILPLYARLSAAQQQRVFQPHGRRRIILSTNVAETSLTVPGIRYVVDTGLARVSRYSYRTKVQRLPIERISQASAAQRTGRCGRVSAGICIRLYDEEDFQSRPRFTDPEILRTNLASVILQMAALGLGPVERFPFVEAPDPRFVRDGFRLLAELGAVDDRQRLTELGRRLARLPLDPRLGRMLLAAEQENCLREVLIVAAALSLQDPRQRPMDQAQIADQKHRLFQHEQSDFLSFLQLWNVFHEQAHHLSNNKLRKWAKEHFLSYVRMRDWHDVERQLQSLVSGMGMGLNEIEASYEAIHRALLSGLLGNLAMKIDRQEYLGARNLKLQIFPGSGQHKRGPKWIMAAELVETGRRYARTVAAIQPQWVESLAGHLVKRSYGEPHWQKKVGQVSAYEKVTLYGLPIVTRRRINYGPIDPVVAREIFIREALVGGEMRTQGPFLAHNRRLVSEIEELEAKSRRRDLLVDEEELYRFYDERLPQGIYNAPRFERWRRRAERDSPRLLYLSADQLLQRSPQAVDEGRFPAELEVGGLRLALAYRFEPGQVDDGLTVTVPLAALNQLQPERFEWLVPGLLEEKISLLIKGLPKRWRRNFVPVPDFARACANAMAPGERPLLEALTEELQRMTGLLVPKDAWRAEPLPAHCLARFRVVDAEGVTLATGRDLGALQQDLGERARQVFHTMSHETWERQDVTDWDFGSLPEAVDLAQRGMQMRGYPALVVGEGGLALRLLDSAEDAHRCHRAGVLALYRRRAARSVKHMRRNLPGIDRSCLHYAALGSCGELKEDISGAALNQVFLAAQAVPRTREAFEAGLREGEPRLMGVANDLCAWVGAALSAFHAVRGRLKANPPRQWLQSLQDVRRQLDGLIYPGFVQGTPYAQLAHLERYLKGILLRLDKLQDHAERDRRQLAILDPWWRRWEERCDRLGEAWRDDPATQAYRWLLEEFRVSLFAQELGTAVKVSPERLDKAWKDCPAHRA